MNDEILMKLIEIMQNLSPQLWDILMRKVYTEIYWGFGWAAGLGTLVYLGIKNKQKLIDSVDSSDTWSWSDGFDVVYWIVQVFLIMLSVVLVNDAIVTLLNPEYYALKLLLNQ